MAMSERPMENEILQQILNEVKGIKSDVSELKHSQTETNQRLDKLEQGQTKLEQGQSKLESEVTRIRESVVLIENDHGRKLGALLDGYAMLANKLEPLPDAVETLQEDVSVIKAVVANHSKVINKKAI